MKRVAVFSLGWSLASPPDKQAQEKAQVATLLREIGREKLYNPEKNWYPVGVEVSSRAFEILIKIAQESDLVRLIRIERVYSSEELQAAPLLEWGPTNQAIEDDYYDLKVDGYQGGPQASHRRCPACRAELEQVRDLLVDTRLMGQRDLSLTYSFEVILSARLAQRLQEAGFTGFTLRPVWDYRKPYQGEPKLYQLVVTNVLPPMASPPPSLSKRSAVRCAGPRRNTSSIPTSGGGSNITRKPTSTIPRRCCSVPPISTPRMNGLGGCRMVTRW